MVDEVAVFSIVIFLLMIKLFPRLSGRFDMELLQQDTPNLSTNRWVQEYWRNEALLKANTIAELKALNNDVDLTIDKIWPNLTNEMVKVILEQAKKKFDAGESMKTVYGEKIVGWVTWSLWVLLIMAIQKYLGIIVDGIYGPNTKKKVLEFQRKNNLTQDGQAGKETITKILEIFGTNPPTGI